MIGKAWTGLAAAAIGAVLFGAGIAGGLGCTAQQAGGATRTIDAATSFVDIPVVSDPAVHAWMAAVAKRFDELARRDAELAGEAGKPRNLSLGDWMTALLGVGTTGAGAVAVARSMHTKNAGKIGEIAKAVMNIVDTGSVPSDDTKESVRRIATRSPGRRPSRPAGVAANDGRT